MVLEEVLRVGKIDFYFKVSRAKENGSKEVIPQVLHQLTSSLEILEQLECKPLKQQLQDSWDYVKEMGAVEEIEDFQNIKVRVHIL